MPLALISPTRQPYTSRSKTATLTIILSERARKSSILSLSPAECLRPVLGKLRQGNAVVILLIKMPAKRIPATFFGKTAMTYPTPAALALQTGCPVIHAHIQSDGELRRFRIIFGKPFPLIDTGNREQDLLANTQQYNDYLENLVRSDPARWFGWLHNRWKIPRRFSENKPTPHHKNGVLHD